MLYRHRCGKCRARQSLKRKANEYLPEKQCACGGKLNIDRYRHKHEVGRNANPCRCDGYWFPHRRGSLWCNENVKGPSKEQINERYGEDTDMQENKPIKSGNRRRVNIVRATGEGTSKVRKESKRGAVLAAIEATGNDGVSVVDLDAQLGFKTRPYLHKLIEKNHIEDLT